MFAWLKALRRSLATRPVLAGASGTPIGPLDVFMARRDDYDDEYDDEPRRPRRGSVADRAGRRFSSSGATKKGNDTMKIYGIVAAVIVVIIIIALIYKPQGEIQRTGSIQAPEELKALAFDIITWRAKDSPEKLFPPQTDQHWPGSTFVKRFSRWKIKEEGGYRFYYSVKPDRTGFVVACAPMQEGIGEKCYCIEKESINADRVLYSAQWSSPGDMAPPEKGQKPVVTYSWTAIE
ncbi:MAG: hypothetical protein U5N86_00950 [Planctomycetota bacterium]|nr:hypothetical protein [Planctomycetota bacterium]